MAAQPPHVGTIGDKIRIGHGIWINCLNQECLHRAKVDLAALADRYGVDLPVADLVKRAVCSDCGSRWPGDGFPKFRENVGNSTGCARLSQCEIVSVLGRQLENHSNG